MSTVALQCLKWNFSQPRAEFLDQLKDQMTNAGVNKTLMTQMFHSDFKQHIKAIDTVSGVRICRLLATPGTA